MHSLPSTSKGQPVARQAARRCRAGEERNHRCARSWWDRALLWVDGGYDKNMQAATSGQWSPRSGAIEHLRSHTVGSWLPSASGSPAPLPSVMDGREPSIWVAFERLHRFQQGPMGSHESRGVRCARIAQRGTGKLGSTIGGRSSNNATLRELFPFYGEHGKSRRIPSWLVFRSETIASASSNRVRRKFRRSCSQ